jgi:c-di-GMP-binding flagellar brake protein YcgR
MKDKDGFEEKRKTARLNVSVEVRYRVTRGGDEVRDCTARDISAGGCLLRAREELPAGTAIELDIILDGTGKGSLKLRGEVVRLEDKGGGEYEAGIAFERLDERSLSILVKYCFKKMYEMIGLPEWPTSRLEAD